MEKRETLIKGGETDTEGIGVFWKKSTRILERKIENKEKEEKREKEKNGKHARRLKKERERRKRKGEHVKNREKREKKQRRLILLSYYPHSV